jgi:hypothetical protein
MGQFVRVSVAAAGQGAGKRMGAGDSARAEADRVRAKIERLQRYLVDQERGADGEQRTAEVLARLGRDWVVFHDLRWPGRYRANIDHVVIGPTGVYVIDSKNWSGDVRVTDTLRQNGHRRDNAISGATDAALAVAGLLGPFADLVKPVVGLVGQTRLVARVDEVLVCSLDTLPATLTRGHARLLPAQILDAAMRLDAQTRPAMVPDPLEGEEAVAGARPSGPRSALAAARRLGTRLRPVRRPVAVRSGRPRPRFSIGAIRQAFLSVFIVMAMLCLFMAYGPAVMNALGRDFVRLFDTSSACPRHPAGDTATPRRHAHTGKHPTAHHTPTSSGVPAGGC